MGFARAAVFALAASLVAPSVSAQTLYKLVDKSGKISYADRVPKGFDGEVTSLVIDPAANVQAPARAAPAAKGEVPEARDRNTERREARARLRLALDRALAKLEVAKRARAEGGDPRDDEYQTIQQKFAAGNAKPDAPSPRPNCSRQGPNWICPTIVPGEKYRDRLKELDDAVSRAEAELAEAETAYRKGTD